MKSTPPRCIIIGAGMAGISAAIACIHAGFKPIVLESKAYIGGRSRSFIDTTTGELIDNGQHLLMGCYTSVLDIANTLGSSSGLQWQKSLEVRFRDTDGTADSFGPSRLPAALGALASLVGMRRISCASKWRAILMMNALKGRFSPPAHHSATDVLHAFRQPQELIERFWEPFILATMNAHPGAASGSVLVEVLRQSILAGGKNSSLVIPRLGLSALVDPFPAWLQAQGGELHLHTNAEELVTDGTHCSGVRISSGEVIEADMVILALPPYACRRILCSHTGRPVIDIHESLASTSGIVSTYLWFDRSFMEESLCAALGTTTQWVFNRRMLHQANADVVRNYPGHLTLTTSAADAMHEESAERIVERSLEELHKLFPAFGGARLLHSRVIKERRATMMLTPEAHSHRPPTQTALENVMCSGDWTQTGLPATLEGAARSGQAAVHALNVFCSQSSQKQNANV
ncbi:MAG: hydroxysqualene dehydroxylase HpnE [Candidatus Kapaibacterium sp.]